MAKRRGKRMTQPTLPPLASLAELPPEAQRINGKVMKAEWWDPTDLTPNAARTARTVIGYRGFDPLRKCLKRHGAASSITSQHIVAADLLRAWGDGARIGFSASRDAGLPVTSIIYRPMTGPTKTAQHQARCWRRFVRVMAIFTRPQRELLTSAVLMNIAVSRIAEARGCCPRRTMGELTACLDMLVTFLDSEVRDVIDRGVEAV